MSLVRFSGLFVMITAAAVSPVGGQESDFVPVTDAVLQNPDPGDWLRWRRDHSAGGYSPLEQVNRQNVSKLGLAWAWPMEDGPQEQEPIVYKGVMYLPHPNNVVQALDARTGKLIWEYHRELPEDVGNIVTRNIAIYQDKVFLGTPDAYLVALAAKTGNVVWETKVADYQQRDRYTAGPIAADGKVFAGLSCSVGTLIPCFMTAHDAATGRLVFAGDFHRYFRAFDAHTGQVLWELPLTGPVTGYPISYAVDGKQYVAIGAGEGTGGQRHLGRLYPELKAPQGSNILMVFALGE